MPVIPLCDKQTLFLVHENICLPDSVSLVGERHSAAKHCPSLSTIITVALKTWTINRLLQAMNFVLGSGNGQTTLPDLEFISGLFAETNSVSREVVCQVSVNEITGECLEPR